MTPQDELKSAAAERAVAEVRDGMVVGLGSGSTARLAIEALARRGLDIVGIPSSERSAALARQLGLRLTSFAAHRRIDLTIDGADQVERGTLTLVKGGGGSLLREKIVAAASARMLVIVDESKIVDSLGPRTPLPIEVVPFGEEVLLDRVAALGCTPSLRMAGEAPFVTDGGHHIIDCVFAAIPDPPELEAQLAQMVGVVESGLFVGLASAVVVGRSDGVAWLTPQPR